MSRRDMIYYHRYAEKDWDEVCSIKYICVYNVSWIEVGDKMYHPSPQVVHLLSVREYVIRVALHMALMPNMMNSSHRRTVVPWFPVFFVLPLYRFDFIQRCTTPIIWNCDTSSSVHVNQSWVLLLPTEWSQVTQGLKKKARVGSVYLWNWFFILST